MASPGRRRWRPMFGGRRRDRHATTARRWPGLLGEVVATVGLLLVIFAARTGRTSAPAYAVGAYITAAYWFTSSTSFANPAVTIARTLSPTFAGIAPASAPGVHCRREPRRHYPRAAAHAVDPARPTRVHHPRPARRRLTPGKDA